MATQATNDAKAKELDRRTKAYHILERAYHMACDDKQGGAIQLGAMKLFLSKTLPDLKAIEVTGDMEIKTEHFIFRRPG